MAYSSANSFFAGRRYSKLWIETTFFGFIVKGLLVAVPVPPERCDLSVDCVRRKRLPIIGWLRHARDTLYRVGRPGSSSENPEEPEEDAKESSDESYPSSSLPSMDGIFRFGPGD